MSSSSLASQKPRRNFRALIHRFLFHWRDDARRMTAIEASLASELQDVRNQLSSLETEVVELRENSRRIAELIDIVEQQITGPCDPRATGPRG